MVQTPRALIKGRLLLLVEGSLARLPSEGTLGPISSAPVLLL